MANLDNVEFLQEEQTDGTYVMEDRETIEKNEEEAELGFSGEINKFFQERSGGVRLEKNDLGRRVIVPTQNKTAEKNAIENQVKQIAEKSEETIKG